MVATGQEKGEKIKILQDQGLVREFNFKSGKLNIFWISQGKAKFPGNMNDFFLSWSSSWWEMVPHFFLWCSYCLEQLTNSCWFVNEIILIFFILFSSFSHPFHKFFGIFHGWERCWISRILLNKIGWQTKTNVVFPKKSIIFSCYLNELSIHIHCSRNLWIAVGGGWWLLHGFVCDNVNSVDLVNVVFVREKLENFEILWLWKPCLWCNCD